MLGHEPTGIVEEVSSTAGSLAVGDRVVIAALLGLSQRHGKSPVGLAAGQVSGHSLAPVGQAEFLRVPHADYVPITVPEGPPDQRFVYLSDVLPKSWQASALGHQAKRDEE